MSSENVERFQTAVGGTATIHETTAASFDETLPESIEEPAIGTPLPFEGVSLAETPVDTAFTPQNLLDAATGVTPVAHGIGNYGSVTIDTDAEGTALVSLYPPRHVAVLAASTIGADMKAAYEELETRVREPAQDGDGAGFGSTVLATGPSATADMGTLVHGVHGPKDVHIVLLEDR